MNRYYYDLHIHSCLSPCGDNESTPASLAGMAAVIGLDILALTDHNSARNCPAFFAAAEEVGIIPIAGMELTTAEDIHVVCLFPTLGDALRFNDLVDERIMKVKNRPAIFGEQLIMNEHDEVIGRVDNLLSVATDISVEVLPEIVADYNGICYPAHIDRDSNGIIAILGTLPDMPHFNTVELRDKEKLALYTKKYGLGERNIIFSSDSHLLGVMNDRENYIELDADPDDKDAVVKALFERLR